MSKNKIPRQDQREQNGGERQYNNHSKVAEERGSNNDISRVDQQEGAMDHGELGGNFKDGEDQNKSRGNE